MDSYERLRLYTLGLIVAGIVVVIGMVAAVEIVKAMHGCCQ